MVEPIHIFFNLCRSVLKVGLMCKMFFFQTVTVIQLAQLAVPPHVRIQLGNALVTQATWEQLVKNVCLTFICQQLLPAQVMFQQRELLKKITFHRFNF